MSKQDFKYWFEEHKQQVGIAGAAILAVLVLLGLWFWFSRDNEYNEEDGVAIQLADYVLARRGDGHLELIDVEDNEVVDTMNLSNDFTVFRGDHLDMLYIYDTESVQEVVVGDDQLTTFNTVSMPEMENVEYIEQGGDHFGFLTEDELIVADSDGNTALVFEDRVTDVFHLGDEGVYLSVDNEIHFVSYDEETTYIDLGDETTRFSQHGETVVSRNNFGSGEDVESVINMTDGSLYIDHLSRMPFSGKVDLQVPRNENQLVYVEYTEDGDGELVRQDLATISISQAEELDSDEEVDLADFTLPMETTEEFADYKSLAVRGFVYDWTDTGVRIIEMRNGREVTRLNTHSEEVQLYVPIYVD